MINLACGVIRISSIPLQFYVVKIACLESFKLDMINLSCGVIRISSKCSCLEIFDLTSNPNLIFIVVIPYHLVSKLSLGLISYQICSDSTDRGSKSLNKLKAING